MDEKVEQAQPSTDGVTDSAQNRGLLLLRRAIEAHGGNVYEDLSDLAVSFAGRWGRIGPRLQPILADREFRVASEERYLLREDVAFQWHVGPDGEKIVFRRGAELSVLYNGRRSRDNNRLSASAAALDLYESLLIGPSWFTRREIEATVVGSKNLGGEPHDLLEVTFKPGLGSAPVDVLTLWLQHETHVLQRVEGTLSGFAPLEGRKLEITLGGHQWLEGKLWATEYLQRVDAAVKVVYHRWQMTGFEVNRGLDSDTLEKIKRGRPDLPALRPANPIALAPKP